MSLSEHELRVLQEIEQELAGAPSCRLRQAGWLLADRPAATFAGIGAVAVVVALALLPVGLAAPLATVCGATVGYLLRGWRCSCARYRRRGD